MASKMTFHESYGDLPVKTLKLIKKFNVSPADFTWMEMTLSERADAYGPRNWEVFDDHIQMNSASGCYIPRMF